MNKKEQKAFEDLQQELAKARALCFPSYPKRERMTAEELTPPEGRYSGSVVVAWYQNNHDCLFTVRQGCSNGYNHNAWGTDQTTTQTCGEFYRTKTDALRVARHEMTERFAEALARIDACIAEEQAKEAA